MLVDVVDDIYQGQVLLTLLLSKVLVLHPLTMVLLPPPHHAMTVLMVFIIALGQRLTSQKQALK